MLRLRLRLRRTDPSERGQVTAEYAVGAVATAGIAAVILGGPETVVVRWAHEFVAEGLSRALTSTLPDLLRWPW